MNKVTDQLMVCTLVNMFVAISLNENATDEQETLAQEAFTSGIKKDKNFGTIALLQAVQNVK